MIAAPATTAAARAAATSAAVIGAGPAGLAVVARLLDTGAPRITWIDPAFNGGRLARYPEVPSNTKVALFLQYAAVSPALTKAADAAATDPRATLAALEQGKGCALVHAQKLCADLASALATAFPDRVDVRRGWVSAVHAKSNAEFVVDVVDGVKDDFAPNGTVSSFAANGTKSTTVHAARLFLCTGSEPTPTPVAPAPHASFPHVRVLDLDTCLTPSALPALLKPTDRVAVVGSSHSAVLVLKNLSEYLTDRASAHVVNFTRHALKYAEYQPDGTIKYDNTGLKGVAADWARAVLEDTEVARKHGIERVTLPAGKETEAYAAHLPGVTHIVYAIGYRARPLPPLILDGKPVDAGKVSYDHTSGALKVEGHGTVAGAHGFGIAFPERITDKWGNVEWSVGMWKFMRYIREVIV
ncbi:hypothetical protein GGF32_010093 [Allomyces javanicus]|nr:hypothetical protein GGF32_010093 [Allomyces javanicus]